MPEGKNKPHKELLPRVQRVRRPASSNPQSIGSREIRRLRKLAAGLPGMSVRRIGAGVRHKQGESNRGKDLMSDAERDQTLRGSQRIHKKRVKQRKGVVPRATAIRNMKHPLSQGLGMTPRNIRRHNKKKK